MGVVICKSLAVDPVAVAVAEVAVDPVAVAVAEVAVDPVAVAEVAVDPVAREHHPAWARTSSSHLQTRR